ncbi:MAG: glycosyltransferase family 39 protein, partial [Patescibacteria group bacterium]
MLISLDRLFVVLTLSRRHMFALAAIVGTISYVVFGLGLMARLQSQVLTVVVVGSIVTLGLWVRMQLKIHHHMPKLSRIEKCLLMLISTQLLINLIGALGPELGFDALWYHLTLPKIYLEQTRVFYLPGSLFAYSAIPKLTEMVYLLGLWAHGAVIAKLINYSFGVLILAALYRLARTYLSRAYALLTVLVFSSNLVFAWQSITAYVDLARTWFDVLALLAWVTFTQKKKTSLLMVCGAMVGLATATKMIGLSSLLIFIVLLLIHKKRSTKNLIALMLPAMLIPLPWFVFAFIATGNPIFPVFSPFISFSISMPHIPYRLEDLKQFWLLFFRSPDPLSPIYAMAFPLVFIVRKKLNL